MNITCGTANFRSKHAAELYYAEYGYDDVKAVVQQKIDEEEIFIGAPALRPGQSFYWNIEGRAVIQYPEDD